MVVYCTSGGGDEDSDVRNFFRDYILLSGGEVDIGRLS